MSTSLLCDIVENLCASFVVFRRLQTTSSLHNVTLPRSWFLNLLKDGQARKYRDTTFHGVLLEPILTLMGRIHASLDPSKSHFFHSNDAEVDIHLSIAHVLSRDPHFCMLSSPTRHIFIFRLQVHLLPEYVRILIAVP